MEHESLLYYELEKNLEAISSSIRIHAANQVDLVLFPECAITGYNTGILKVDHCKILESVKVVQDLAKAHKIFVALSTPWPDGSGALHNSVLLVSSEGDIQEIFRKIGLQKGEEKLFTAGENHQRTFILNGYKVGIIMCVETSHEPWAYLKKSDAVDLIFWPGFYASAEEDLGKDSSLSKSVSDQKVRDNHLNHWQVPLLLVNCASSPESHFWPGKLFGGSVVYGEQHAQVFRAKYSKEDFFVVEFKEKSFTVTQI